MSNLFPKGKADSCGASNGHGVLAVLEMARFRRRVMCASRLSSPGACKVLLRLA